MTPEEIEQAFGLTFHDAELHAIVMDYRTKSVTMDVKVDFSGRDRAAYRGGRLAFSGVLFCAINAPCVKYDYEGPGPLWISEAYDTRTTPQVARDIDPELLAAVPESHFVNSFFVNDWNSFIHIAAAEAQFAWTEEIGSTS